jgi:Protein of unknown function (DUF3021).
MEKQNYKLSVPALTCISFSIGIIVLSICGSLIGDSVKQYATMLSLGNQGLPFSTIFEFLGASFLIAVIQKLIYSDLIFKKMMTLWRTVILLFCIILVIFCFVVIFGWFPVTSVGGWVGFFVSFGVCFLLSTLFMILKIKYESKKYQDSLLEYKKSHQEEDSEHEQLY